MNCGSAAENATRFTAHWLFTGDKFVEVQERSRKGRPGKQLSHTSILRQFVVRQESPLLIGACVVVPDDTEVTDPEKLAALLVSSGVTAWSSAPALLELLVGYAYDRDVLGDKEVEDIVAFLASVGVE